MPLKHHYFERKNTTVSTQSITTTSDSEEIGMNSHTSISSKFDHESNAEEENACTIHQIYQSINNKIYTNNCGQVCIRA